MNPATAQILQRVSALPPLPAAIGRLLRLVNDPDGDFQEIARTIALDQTLTAQILRIANSAFYGFSHQIRTVQQATVILGRHAVRNMALSLAMITLRNRMQTGWPLTPEVFWRHSMGVACGASLLARHVRGADAEEAFVAGLLHDIGKILLMEHDARTYGRLLEAVRTGAKPLHVLERETFGIDHTEVGRALCQHWNIPDTLGAVTAAHHGDGAALPGDAVQLAAFVHLANVLAKLASIGDGGNPLIPANWRRAAATLPLAAGVVPEVLRALPGEVARNEQIFFQTAQAAPVAADNTQYERDPGLSVRIALAQPEHSELVALILHAHRIPYAADASSTAPSVVVTDRVSTPGMGNDSIVIDFGRWNAGRASAEWIDVQQLQHWLLQHLPSPAAAL